MNVALLYPGTSPIDALSNWAKTLIRHCHNHKVVLVENVEETTKYDVVFILTAGDTFQRSKIDICIKFLGCSKVPHAVIHNEDNPAVPSVGNYRSFCWTKRAFNRLQEYRPTKVRMPLFDPVVNIKINPLLVATFGHAEPKKHTWRILDWANQIGVPFCVFTPDALAAQYEDYIRGLRADGCEVVVYPWHEKIEDLAQYFEKVSHFLFDLTGYAFGTGGTSTSCRYASFFCRPVIVIEDDMSYSLDNYYVFDSLSTITKRRIQEMTIPDYLWNPDCYISKLIEETLR